MKPAGNGLISFCAVKFLYHYLNLHKSLRPKDKYQFAVIVRRFIYNCRFHNVKRYNEEILRQIEDNIYAKIKYSNDIYNVLYCFESSYTPLAPGEIIDNKKEVSTHWERREKAQENKQIDILRSYYKENMQKLDELLELVQDNQQIGISIAKSLDYRLDRIIIEMLHKHKKHAILLLYIRNVIFPMETRDAIESISCTFAGFDMETRFLALSSLAIDDTTIKYVDSLAEEERNYYYLNINSYVKDLKRESLKEYFTNLLKAKNYEGIRILMLNNDLELVDYINLLKSYASYDDNKGNAPLRDYELTKIFKKIYEVDHIPENLVEDIIILEIVYFRILYSVYERLNPQFLINKLFNDAGYLVQIIRITFFTDQDEKRECTDEELRAIKFYDYLISHIHFCPCVDTNNQYHPEKWNKWIKDFIEGVTKNNQINVGLKILGRFFSYFPKGHFPGWLPEEICQLIDNYNDAGLKHFFFIQCINNRSAHYCNHGSEDIPLIEEYKHYAEALSIKYPITASIFRNLANHYNSEKQQKREQASHTVY